MRGSLAFVLLGTACSSSTTDATDASIEDAPVMSQMDAHVATDAPGSDASDAKADPCIDRTVCDDFEKAMGGKPDALWKVLTSKGTATIDTTKAFSGKQSLKVSIDPTTAQDTYRRAAIAIQGAPLIPLANDTVYGRFMITTDRIPDKTVHWTIAHGDGPVGNLSATYNYGGMGGLMANYYKNSTPNATDCWQTKTQNFPTQKWTCVAFLFDGKNSEMRFWLDGQEVPELHVIGLMKNDTTCTISGVDGKWYAPTFSNIFIGWESYQHDAAGAHTAWIDDVILDDTSIPCP
jgi:hypothetical protein